MLSFLCFDIYPESFFDKLFTFRHLHGGRKALVIEWWVQYLRADLYFVPEAGEAARAVRQLDWSATPLGPPEGWPVQLKTAVQIMLASLFPQAVIWGPDYTTIYNDAFRAIIGKTSGWMGKPLDQIWKDAWDELGPITRKAFEGEATYIEDYPLLVSRFGHLEQCYFTFCYSPILDSDGRVGGVMNTLIETTGKVEAERNAKLINTELAHRIKNTFSIVQAIATQTFRTDGESEHLRSFGSRLHALANAHEVLRMGRNSSGSIENIIGGITASLGVEDRVHMEGHPITIGPKGALSMSLVVHELMTNAMKYGSLSQPEGIVTISWKSGWQDGEPTLYFYWEETGGPRVRQPAAKGFGSRLIEMGLLGTGDVRMIYRPEGLQTVMTAPLRQIQSEGRLDTAEGT